MAKKQRNIEILTVMSWENEYHNGEWLRAIALCDSANYFEVDDRYGHHVIRELLPPVWWKRLWKYIRNIGKDNSLPF